MRMNQRSEIPTEKRIDEPYSFSKVKIGRELGYPLSVLYWTPHFTGHPCIPLCTLCAIWDIQTPMLFWTRVSFLSGEDTLQFAAGA